MLDLIRPVPICLAADTPTYLTGEFPGDYGWVSSEIICCGRKCCALVGQLTVRLSKPLSYLCPHTFSLQDTAGLSADPETFKRYRTTEVIHAR